MAHRALVLGLMNVHAGQLYSWAAADHHIVR
jgi:hypothetical protein